MSVQVLVLEHLSGGEMLRQLQRMKRYSEANACQIFKQVRIQQQQDPQARSPQGRVAAGLLVWLPGLYQNPCL